MNSLTDALARVPSPVREWPNGEGGDCKSCLAEWDRVVEPEWHKPDCWWPPFVAAREALAARGAPLSGPSAHDHGNCELCDSLDAALAAGVTVEGMVAEDGARMGGCDVILPDVGGHGGQHVWIGGLVAAPGQRVRVTVRPVEASDG